MTDVSTTCAKLSSESRDRFFDITKIDHLTRGYAYVVETSVANNSPSKDCSQPDNHFRSEYVTPGFKLFSNSVKFGGTYPLNSNLRDVLHHPLLEQ